MDTPDDDLEFDFFEDEPATTEAQSQSRVRLPRRGGRGPGVRRPSAPPRGLTPLLRLLAVIAILIAALVFFGLLIQSCASTSKHDTYKNYMAKVGSVAQSSSSDGAELASELTTQGVKVADIESKLGGLAQQEQQAVAVAQRIDPPGRLRPEHQNLVEALQLRVNGIQGLADAFRSTAGSKSSGDAALLAAPAQRLLASDVMWDDLFQAPAASEMKRQGITDVAAPESHFVTNQDLITERSMALVLQRLRGASTSGTPTGLHGTNIVSTKVLPGGSTLSQDQNSENTITAGPDLQFAVAIADSGDSQEVGIKVTLTIQKPGGPIVKTKTLALINPSQEKTVTFGDLGAVPFAQKTTVSVDVAAVPGEHTTSNNKATYPVIFSLG
jgi:hypothetical protein